MCGRTETRIIRQAVLSVRGESVAGAAKTAAVHHAQLGIRLLATTFDPTASVDSQSFGSAYRPQADEVPGLTMYVAKLPETVRSYVCTEELPS